MTSFLSSPPSLARFSTLLLASAYISSIGALDIAFDRIQCDQSLPAYASADDVRMTCDDGQNTRCSFGQDAMIRGTLQYHNLDQYSYNGTGYASANLRLLSVEYNLFDSYPIDFCGDWIEPYNYSYSGDTCPGWDGFYYFNVPYTLPWDDDDITTWFATGWQGVSTLQVYSGKSADSTLLTDCTLHWHTFVTPSEEDGWKTMPSAAQTGIILASVLAFMCCCCTYITCCRQRKKHVTDVGYASEYGASTDFKKFEEKKEKRRKRKKNRDADRVEEVREG